MNTWRDEPPRVGEWDAPDILGWAFRGQLRDVGDKAAYLKRVAEHGNSQFESPIDTTDRGIVVELLIKRNDGLPLWAQYHCHLFYFHDLRGQWCTIKVQP